MTHDLWTTLNAKMYEYLSSVTLSQLVDLELRKVGGEAVIQDSRARGLRAHAQPAAVSA